MSDIIKEMWFKWRAKVYLGKVDKGGLKRLALKDKQLVDKAKATEYLAKYNKVKEL